MKRTSSPRIMGGALAALVLLAPGCGGGLSQVQQTPAAVSGQTGSLSVHLVQDGLPGGLAHLDLNLASLELRVDGTWQPVPLAPAEPIDLLAATSAAPVVLAAQVPWSTGSNDLMRFTVGSGSTVQLSAEDASVVHALDVPGTFVSSLGPPGSFSVPAQGSADLWIAFGVQNVALPGADGDAYSFVQGAIRGYEKGSTGAITGTLTGTAGAPLQGAAVTAQMQLQDGAAGAATAYRTVQTDAAGGFTLDLLPKGATWCVVSLPVAGGTVYGAQASQGFAVGDAPADQYQCRLAFTAAPVPGAVAGTAAAPAGAGQQQVVDLVQEIPVGGVPYRFVLGSALVGSDGFSFPVLPPGDYTAVLNTYSVDPAVGRVDQPQSTGGFAVTAGNTTTVPF